MLLNWLANGAVPVIISTTQHPTDQMSACLPTLPCMMTSGAMKLGVPFMDMAVASTTPDMRRDAPKSATLTFPSASRRQLAHLTSLWTMQWAWR